MGEREDELVSAHEIAKRFEMPVSTVYWMADNGIIPFVDRRKPYHQRRRLLFDPDKVKVALDARAVPPPAPDAP